MSEMVTHALTLWRPWPWAILYGGKAVENRTWAPPSAYIGRRIAIHAGKKWDEYGFMDICDELGLGTSEKPADGAAMRREGIVGTARIVGFVRDGLGYPPEGRLYPPPVLAAGSWGKSSIESIMPWYNGPFGWLLDDVIELLPPLPCKGAQGLWPLPHRFEVRS